MPSSIPSTASLNRATSTQSNRHRPPPVANVVTSPPWAKDEPPSPKAPPSSSLIDTHHATDSRPSDVASFLSHSSTPASRWWSFTLSRPREPFLKEMTSLSRPERRTFGGRSMSWLNTATGTREGSSFARKEREKPEDSSVHDDSNNRHWPPPITLPPPAPHADFRQNSAVWDIPWTPRNPHGRLNNLSEDVDLLVDDKNKALGPWSRRRKKLRNFILNNIYVPLLFRFVGISFTAAALGMAIQIRQLEVKHDVMGAVGSSPMVVIIFAPPTLVHVMAAIYLEYFGRPLGLWRTSGKLTHTLSEVLVICAWSAALSLCFDNFFTSHIPCASPRHMAWYNRSPHPSSNVPNFEEELGDHICSNQLSLICLVGVGLLVYCANLIISLFRIFEKIKYHPTTPPTTA